MRRRRDSLTLSHVTSGALSEEWSVTPAAGLIHEGTANARLLSESGLRVSCVPAPRRTGSIILARRRRLYMFLSLGSLSRSDEVRMTTLSLSFFHQCETSLRSTVASPVLCTIGTEQLLACSTMVPETT